MPKCVHLDSFAELAGDLSMHHHHLIACIHISARLPPRLAAPTPMTHSLSPLRDA
jgi:hypothetical protein